VAPPVAQCCCFFLICGMTKSWYGMLYSMGMDYRYETKSQAISVVDTIHPLDTMTVRIFFSSKFKIFDNSALITVCTWCFSKVIVNIQCCMVREVLVNLLCKEKMLRST